jgi:predicted amidohydrolase
MSAMRLAIAQLAMHWTVQDNLASIVDALQRAADEGARLCVFSELALTGFHRQIGREADAAKVQPALDAVRAQCRRLQVACALGAPTWSATGRVRNSHLHIDEHGEIAAVVDKTGLTESEAGFFEAGTTRARSTLRELACTSVLCREVDDLPQLRAQLPPTGLDLIFWPSFIGHPLSEASDEPDYLPQARAVAQAFGAWVVHCNWPHSLNRPEATHMGGSHVIAPDGRVAFSLPLDHSGLAVFALGDANCAWIAQTDFALKPQAAAPT